MRTLVIRAAAGAASLALTGVLAGFGAAPVGAAEADGCSGRATSVDEHGHDLDVAHAPGSGATASDPFVVDPDGKLVYEGSTDRAFGKGTWTVKIYGLSGFSGTVDNEDGSSDVSGVEPLGKHLSIDVGPFTTVATGTYKVELVATGRNGARCVITGYIKIDDDPVRSPLFAVSALLLLFGILLFALFGRPEPFIDVTAGAPNPAEDTADGSVGAGFGEDVGP